MNGASAGACGPQLLVFGGPNGSGKSTVNAQILKSFAGEYVNADDLARVRTEQDLRERNLAAARDAQAQRLAALRAGRDLAYETVLSTEEKVADLIYARRLGYQVNLIYVVTQDPELNVLRVANRVATGGHAVAPEKIRERYARCLALLPSALEKVSGYQVIDTTGRQVRPVISNPPGPLDGGVAGSAPYRAAQRELDARTASLRRLSGDEPWTWGDARHGAEHVGRGRVTEYHVALETPRGLELHDLSLVSRLDRVGARYCVNYAYVGGKRVAGTRPAAGGGGR